MAIFDSLKSIAKVLQESGKIELYKQILEIQQILLEMQQENAELRTQIRIFEDQLKIKDELVHRNNAYWKSSNNEGPFCTRCWDKGKDLIRMTSDRDIYYNCPECQCSYEGPTYQNYAQLLEEEAKKDRDFLSKI